jgi:hypothetical protein
MWSVSYDSGNPIPASIAPGTITAVTATAPVNCTTSGSSVNCSMAQATSSVDGYLSHVDWVTFNGKQAALGFTPAHSGANSDITSLSGLTTPLTTAQGGSGEAGSITGLLYGNATSPYTQATGAQIVAGIGSTPVQNAYNVQCYGAGCPNNSQWQAPWVYTGTIFLADTHPLGSGDTSMVVTSIQHTATAFTPALPSSGAIVTTAEEEIIYTGVSLSTPSPGLTTLTGLQRGIHGTTAAAVSVADGNIAGIVSETAGCSTCGVIWQQANFGGTSFNQQINAGIGGDILANHAIIGTNLDLLYLPSQPCVGTNVNGTFIGGTCLISSGISGMTTGQLPVAASATTVTSSIAYATANTASTIVARDASNNFSAGTITAALTGNATNITATSNSTLTTLSALSLPYSQLTGTPTIGTWGALNYPTWVSGNPFVKMTAAGTFALDTNTYLTSLSGALLATGATTGATSQAQVFTDGITSNSTVGISIPYPDGLDHMLTMLDPTLTSGIYSSIGYELGVQQDTNYQTALIRFGYKAANSATNNLQLGIYGGTPLTIDGGGNVNIPGASSAGAGSTDYSTASSAQVAHCLADGTGGCAYLGASTNTFTGALSAYSLTSIAAIVPESGIVAGGYSLPISGNTLLFTAGQTGANSVQFSTTTGGNAFSISGTTSYLLLQAFPTSCSGQPSKTIAAIGWVSGTTPGTLTLCP